MAGAEISEEAVRLMRAEVEALAKAEGIWKDANPRPSASWGLVAIAVNPRSPFESQLRKMWATHFKPGAKFKPETFGCRVIDGDGIVGIELPWKDGALDGIDFCLVTPTKPESELPSAKDIAAAVRLSSYFRRTIEAGIVTRDDAEVQRLLQQDGI
jgi:hypothetical protein